MIPYDELKMKLLKMEDARQSPLDKDSFDESLMNSKRLDEAYDNYIGDAGLFEEFSYASNYPTLYPIPQSYDNSSIDTEQIGFEGDIAPAIRQQVLDLKNVKRPDQSVVYSNDQKKAVLISKTELPEYTKTGWIVVYEEANLSPVGGRGSSGFADTNGSFNKIAATDSLLFKKNKKELKKYKGKVFEVSPEIFKRMEEGKARYSKWSQFIEEEDYSPVVDAIKSYSLRNPTSPVVIQNTDTGERAILRRRTNDSRLKHNRRK